MDKKSALVIYDEALHLQALSSQENDHNSATAVINSQSQTSLISLWHWAIWVEAQWSKNVSQNHGKYYGQQKNIMPYACFFLEGFLEHV